jgi:tetratricopeptide (TPR) repeat protein
MKDGRHWIVPAILIVAIFSGLASRGKPQSRDPSVAKPVLTASGILEEWERLSASPEWASKGPRSPKNSDSRLELARSYLAVGNVPRAEALLREQIARLTEPRAKGVFRPRLYQLLNLEAHVCRAKGDAVGRALYQDVATFFRYREIEDSLVGTVLFPEEYQRCREQPTPSESVDAILLAVLEAVEKRIPDAAQIANDVQRNGNIKHSTNSGGPGRARETVLSSAYRSLAILYAATGHTKNALEIIDKKALHVNGPHTVDKDSGSRDPEFFHERLLDAMSRRGQSQVVAKYLDAWFQSVNPHEPFNRHYARGYLVRALAKDGEVEAARKAAADAFMGEKYLVLAMLEMGRDAEAWAVIKSMKPDDEKYDLLWEIVSRLEKQPISPEKDAEFARVFKVTLEETRNLPIMYAVQVLDRLSNVFRDRDTTEEQRRSLLPLLRNALQDTIARCDFSVTGHDGKWIIQLASVCALRGFADQALAAQSRAAKEGTTIEGRGVQEPIAIYDLMDNDILDGLSWSGRAKEAITIYESWSQQRRDRLARKIVECYLCAGEGDKASAVAQDELKDATKDGDTIPNIAIDAAAQGQFEKALAFFNKWDDYPDADFRVARIDEMRNAAVQYHLKRGETQQALAYARQITSSCTDTFDTKQQAYYAIIKKLIYQQLRAKERPETPN